MNNANDVKHTATCVLLEMAERAERRAAALQEQNNISEEEMRRPPGGSTYREVYMKRRIHDLRRNAEMWRGLAAQPGHEKFNKLRAEFNKLRAEHEVFNKLRAECERVAAEVGCPFKIGEPKPPIHEANARLRNLIGWLRLFGRANPG